MFTFINTMILSGLALLSIPIIIQYLIKRRKIVIYWGAWEWMKKAYQRRKKVTKLHNLLKLISKILLLLALVLLLSRPAILSKGGGNKLVIIDNSLSMGTQVSGGDRLKSAKALASDLIKQSDRKITIYTFDGDMKAIAKGLLSSNALDSAVQNIELSTKNGSFKDFIEQVKSVPDFDKLDTIYFFSDFQKYHYKDEESVVGALATLGKKHRVIFIPADKRKNLTNAALLSCSPLAEGIYPGMENRIAVEVMNFSPQAMTSLPVTLSVNGKKQDRSVVSLGPGERARLFLACQIPEQKIAKIEIEISPDAYPYDNKLTAVIKPGSPIEILAIRPDKPPEGKDFHYDFFFKSALNAFIKMKYEAISPLRSFEKNFDNYDMVVTFGMSFRDKTKVRDKIMQFLEKKRSLIAFADPADTDTWKPFGVVADPEQKDKDVSPLAKMDTYLSFMKDRLNPSLIHFYRFSTISAGTKKPIARLFVQGEEKPITAKVSYQNSNVILNGFLPYPKNTDFFFNPNFVQFIMRMMNDAIGQKSFYSCMGDEIKELKVKSQYDVGSQFQMMVEGGASEMIKAVRSGEELVFAATPMMENRFCKITDGGKDIFDFGYNVSRNDSNIEIASKGDFSKAIDAGLRYQETSDFKEVKAVTEYLWLWIFLLIAAAVFENYVHFWRKDSHNS